MKYPALISIAFVLLFCSCKKVEDINAINTPQGGTAIFTVKNGFDFFEPVIIHTSFTSATMGVIKRSNNKYSLVLENNSNGKVSHQLLLEFTMYEFYGTIDKGQLVTTLPGEGMHTFDMPSDHSAQVYNFAEVPVGQKASGTFMFPANKQGGSYYKVEGSFEAYRLPDAE